MSSIINKNIFIIILSSILFLTNNAFGKDEKKFKVITTFTVLADMAKNVAGDVAIVESITKPGAEIHGYSPTPRDILRAQDADLILWNGLNLELWFKQFFTNLKNVPSITLSDGVVPMGINEGSYKGKPNPHAWMSQESAMIYIDNIVKAALDGISGPQGVILDDKQVVSLKAIKTFCHPDRGPVLYISISWE